MKIKFDLKPDNNPLTSDLKQFEGREVSIEDLLIFASTSNCSDLYIKEYEYPYISRFGKIVKVPCLPTSRDVWMEFQDLYISNQMNDKYMVNRMLDTSIEIRIPIDNPLFGVNGKKFFRYRASFGFSVNARVGTFRMIRAEDPTFDTINYPEQCKNALKKAYENRIGIILFTGPTGSGKTTTLAAVMNTFTQPNDILDNKVFITLEDPIEYEFKSTDSVKFSQKELDKDFISYPLGIKQALREHPNCINVGECRDREVITACIEAARTGHLTTSSFHAGDVGGTISRLLFHLDNNKDLSYDLILNLNIIMSQKLLKRDDKYLVDTQYLLFTNEVREYLLNIINENKNVQLEVNNLIKDKRLQELQIVKDWDYEE